MTLFRIEGQSQQRSFFDPITLGLRLPRIFEPGELEAIVEDGYFGDRTTLAIEHAATGIHEIAHYLQFYGTLLGHLCLRTIQRRSRCLAHLFAYAQSKHGLDFPAKKWAFDLQEVFDEKDDQRYYTETMLLHRYFEEELHGIAYPVHSWVPVPLDGGFVQSSPLWLMTQESGYFPFTGSILLENAAVGYEVYFLSSMPEFPDDFKESLVQCYVNLPPPLGRLYNGLSVWLGTSDIIHLEPLLYFTLLNQPMENILDCLGNYTLAQNTKRVLMRSERLCTIQRPETDDQTRDVLQEIADALDLHNPLDSIRQYNTDLRESIAGDHRILEEDGSWITDYVTCQAFDYFSENPLEIIKWPLNVKKLIRTVPILNVTVPDSEYKAAAFISETAIPSELIASAMTWHLRYCHDVHMLFGLYEHPTIRCPHWIYERPALCELCKSCSGDIPSEMLDGTCPVVERYGEVLQIASRRKDTTNE